MMIYFFASGREFVQCELHEGEPHLLKIIGPDGLEHAEPYRSAIELEDRWSEVRKYFSWQGWEGPFGRDGRV